MILLRNQKIRVGLCIIKCTDWCIHIFHCKEANVCASTSTIINAVTPDLSTPMHNSFEEKKKKTNKQMNRISCDEIKGKRMRQRFESTQHNTYKIG